VQFLVGICLSVFVYLFEIHASLSLKNFWDHLESIKNKLENYIDPVSADRGVLKLVPDVVYASNLREEIISNVYETRCDCK